MGMIVDERGQPLTAPVPSPAGIAGGMRAQTERNTLSTSAMASAPYRRPYEAANWLTQEVGNWLPWIRSPDSEINLYRDQMVARSRDLSRNDGWIVGGVNRILDSTIATNLRLAANPDFRALALRSSVSAFNAEWADDFRRTVESLWRGYTKHPGHFNDVTQQLTVGQQFRLAMRHKLIDGEGLGLVYWLLELVGADGADYATAPLLVDPDRPCNP